LIADFDQLLKSFGFKRVFTEWDRKAGWGDALYARDNIYHPGYLQRFKIMLSRIRRFLRSFIPQWLFPTLVRIKRLLSAFKKFLVGLK